MKIKIWGCRGSLPTPGTDTIKYGGNSTCVEVRLDDGQLIIFDAGSGIRRLGKAIMKDPSTKEMYLFLTHAHWDHLMGFPFFTPIYIDSYKINVRGGPIAKKSLRGYLKQQMEAPYFPVRFDSLRAQFDFTQGDPEKREIGAAQVIPIRLIHPNGCYGFKVIENGKSFVFFTDHELDFIKDQRPKVEKLLKFCEGANLLIHDAQYTDEQYKNTKGWGHSTFNTVIDFGIEANVKKLGMFHHDPEHTDTQLEQFENEWLERVKRQDCDAECFAVKENMETVI